MNEALIFTGALMIYLLIGVMIDQKADSQFIFTTSRIHRAVVCLFIWPVVVFYGVLIVINQWGERRKIETGEGTFKVPSNVTIIKVSGEGGSSHKDVT